jgi:hypothetical protein
MAQKMDEEIGLYRFDVVMDIISQKNRQTSLTEVQKHMVWLNKQKINKKKLTKKETEYNAWLDAQIAKGRIIFNAIFNKTMASSCNQLTTGMLCEKCPEYATSVSLDYKTKTFRVGCDKHSIVIFLKV